MQHGVLCCNCGVQCADLRTTKTLNRNIIHRHYPSRTNMACVQLVEHTRPQKQVASLCLALWFSFYLQMNSRNSRNTTTSFYSSAIYILVDSMYAMCKQRSQRTTPSYTMMQLCAFDSTKKCVQRTHVCDVNGVHELSLPSSSSSFRLTLCRWTRQK